MQNGSSQPTPEAYILSLIAEGRYEAAFAAIGELGEGQLYAADFSNHGQQMLECGEVEQAADLFCKAIALNPELAPAHAGLGIIALRQNKLSPAIEALQHSINLNPNSPGTQTALGIALCNSGRISEAVTHLVRAVELLPNLPTALNALEMIRKALMQKNCNMAFISQARCNELLAQIDQALECSRTAPGELTEAKISVCMIVKNEEANLARCLSSVKSVADEIVIVDTGSTDRTVEIAKEFGAKLGYFEWINDFSAARNYGLSLATGDWLLIMDADDELDPGGDAALRLFLNSRPKADVCSMRTRIPTPSGLETSIEHPRLYRNGLGLHYAGAAHEQLVFADGSPALPQLATGISAYHHGYMVDEAAMQARRERNLQILHETLAEQPGDWQAMFFMAKEYRGLLKYAETIKYMRRALELMPDLRNSSLRMKGYSYLGEALVDSGAPAEAEELYGEALARYPDNAELLFGLGEARRMSGKEAEAVEAYQAALKGRFGSKMANQDFTCRDLKPRLRLAEIALAHGRIEEAEEHWQQAYEVRGELDLLRQLKMRIDDAKAKTAAAQEIELHIMLCRVRLEEAHDDLQARGELVALLSAIGRNDEAEQEARLAVEIAPESPDALNIYGAAMVSGKRLTEAERAFMLAASFEPDNAAILCNLATVQKELGQLTEANENYRAALGADISYTSAYLGLGELLLDRSEWDEARECFEIAVKLSPEDVDAWLGLGRAYAEQQVVNAALTCYEKAVQLSGAAPEVMVELAKFRNKLLGMSQPAGSVQ